MASVRGMWRRLCSFTRPQSRRDLVANRRAALFELLSCVQDAGEPIAPLTAIDDFVDNRRPGFFLKHDVHDVNLDGMVEFAARESKLGIHGTYFFMAPFHPRTRPAYDFPEQIRTMRAIKDLGHEIGIHIDPYFLMHEEKISLSGILDRLRAEFTNHEIEYRIGNMHGNSVHKHPDAQGYGTSFELFSELARQPDYPELKSVPAESAELIRANRVSLRQYGFSHWGDMPMWSARHGFVATNFITDNKVGKQGTLEVLVRPDTTGGYRLSSRQLPGSRNLDKDSRFIPFATSAARDNAAPVHRHIELGSLELKRFFKDAGGSMPLLMLVHPEFYC
jgi:hypothetical protein